MDGMAGAYKVPPLWPHTPRSKQSPLEAYILFPISRAFILHCNNSSRFFYGIEAAFAFSMAWHGMESRRHEWNF